MFRTCAVLAIAAFPGMADVQMTNSYTADGQTAQTTISSNGNRMRYEYGNGLVLLRYCDAKSLVQIDEKQKSYLQLPSQEPASQAGVKTDVVDTGERKELFGHQARHLKITQTTEGKKERTETDGWYLDLSGVSSCITQDAGTAERGYPASYTITTFGENGKPTSTASMRITTMVEGPLASNLFEVPGGYKDSTPRATPNGAVAKAPGAIRVGAVLIRDKSNSSAPNQAFYNRLTAQLMEAKLDLIQLDGPQEAIDRRARETGCDYVLYTEVASVAKPASGKVTGLLHKAPVLGSVTGGNGMEAHIDYRLVPGAGGTPVLTSSAIGRAGTSVDWKAAALLASNFIPMAMAARMFTGALNPVMMNALLSGRGYGASMASMDPMMGGITMLIRAATQGPGGQGSNAQNPMTAEAIAAAIDLEGKAVISQLKPPAR